MREKRRKRQSRKNRQACQTSTPATTVDLIQQREHNGRVYKTTIACQYIEEQRKTGKKLEDSGKVFECVRRGRIQRDVTLTPLVAWCACEVVNSQTIEFEGKPMMMREGKRRVSQPHLLQSAPLLP